LIVNFLLPPAGALYFNPQRIVLLPALIIFAKSMAKNMTYEELVREHPGSLVEKLVTEVVSKDSIDVHFEIEDDEWAVIKVHIYEEDKEMALRLLSEGRWVLQFGYYDDEDEFIELLQPLTQTEIDMIPKGLQKVMLKVLASEEGLRVPGNFLSR
jgi:hypothetical protein